MINLLIWLAVSLLALMAIGHILSLALSAILTITFIVGVLLVAAGAVHLMRADRE